MPTRLLTRLLLIVLLSLLGAIPALAKTEQQIPPPAKVLMLGLFHFDNPGFDAVKYTPIDVMQPKQQAYLQGLVKRIARFKPTKVLLEYPPSKDEVFNERYSNFVAGKYELPKNEIYQLGFRIAKLSGHARVYGFDVHAPAFEDKLWGNLSAAPATDKKLMTLIETESKRLNVAHQKMSLKEILTMSNTSKEDLRNKGFYMLLNDVGANTGLFYGADSAANWWQRNLRMYAVVQTQASPGERVLVIAGSGHTAIQRDLLRADADRQAEDILKYF
jgi:uncharacterized protein YgfB (UPF0149 family)